MDPSGFIRRDWSCITVDYGCLVTQHCCVTAYINSRFARCTLTCVTCLVAPCCLLRVYLCDGDLRVIYQLHAQLIVHHTLRDVHRIQTTLRAAALWNW